jgi:hypothetical protein
MGIFYVVQGEYLVSHGFAQDGQECLQAGPGQTVVLGAVPGFGQGQMQGLELAPHAGARWHVGRCEWVDEVISV